jgi:hypothetical protein
MLRERLAASLNSSTSSVAESCYRALLGYIASTGGGKKVSEETQDEGTQASQESATPTVWGASPPMPTATATTEAGSSEATEMVEASDVEEATTDDTVVIPDDELTAQLETELGRARDVVVAAERAAYNLGFQTATVGGRIECDYDLQAENLICRMVSFELEF